MIISEDILLSYGAIYKNYKFRDVIFTEGSSAKFYFQIVSGSVELNNYHKDGIEFIQDIIYEGQSFGEAFLFINQPYAINAVANTDCEIIKLPKDKFLILFNENSNMMTELFKLMSDKLFYKYILLFNLSRNDPKTKIKVMLDCLKSMHCGAEEKTFVVPYTRQQIANLTGLRVETVIRTVKKMAEDNILTLSGRKIVLNLL